MATISQNLLFSKKIGAMEVTVKHFSWGQKPNRSLGGEILLVITKPCPQQEMPFNTN